MTLSKSSIDEITRMVGSLRAKGVALWSEDGHLRYRASRGALSAADLAHLRASRERLVAVLEDRNATLASGGSELEAAPHRAPLTFSQLQHRHLYHLETRPAIRQIASATRLQGPLDLRALQRSIAEIVNRQGALRTRIVVHDDVPLQEVFDTTQFPLHLEDLTSAPRAAQETAIKLQIDDHILQPIDISKGPLFGVRLLQLSPEEHVMIVAMEHSISDGFSMNLFLRDLFTAYGQARRNRSFLLAPIGLTYLRYARRQHATHQQWIQRHGSYWNDRLAGAGRLRFPNRLKEPVADAKGWGTVPVHIDEPLKNRLTQWCRMAGTTLPMAVFTAYVALVLRWCHADDMTARYVIDGRTDRATQNTIGFFASVLYLRLTLRSTDTFFDLLKRITAEYCSAHQHADHCYLESANPRPDFTRNTAFNWLPDGTGLQLPDSHDLPGELACTPIQFEHPLRRHNTLNNEPVILLNDLKHEIVGSVSYPIAQFSAAAMTRFATNLLVVLETMQTTPAAHVKHIELAK